MQVQRKRNVVNPDVVQAAHEAPVDILSVGERAVDDDLGPEVDVDRSRIVLAEVEDVVDARRGSLGLVTPVVQGQLGAVPVSLQSHLMPLPVVY